MKHGWTEASIARAIAFGLFNGRSVLVVPNCNWTGSECDLLVIEPGLRIVDVEIKISRADLRADLKKEKWWRSRPWSRRACSPVRREWPDKVWKHYYALPKEIWSDELLAAMPASSGIILLDADRALRQSRHEAAGMLVTRRAKPNKEAKPISAADAVDLARLASLRMWSALRQAEQARSPAVTKQPASPPN